MSMAYTQKYLFKWLCGNESWLISSYSYPSFCSWNVNILWALNFLRVSLITPCNTVYNCDLITIVETHLDNAVDETKLVINGYSFYKNNHPQNGKCDGVGLYVKESLPREKLSNPTTGRRSYWSLVNKVVNNAKILLIPLLLENDKFVLNFSTKAQIFNDYFIFQCKTLDTGSEIPFDVLLCAPLLSAFSMSDEKILRIIRSLNPSKAHGWDEISKRMIKICDISLLAPLNLMFEACKVQSTFPELWKRASVVEIIKKVEKSLKTNYRPISLLPTFGNV